MTVSTASAVTVPAWYDNVPADRQGSWTAGESSFKIAGQTLQGCRVAITLNDGTVFDGVMGGERNRWDGNKHSIAIRIPGRKSQKWILRKTIASILSDRGPKLEDLLTTYITRNRSY